MSELYVTFGEMIHKMVVDAADSGDIEFFYSFRQMFDALNGYFDLSMNLYNNAGTPTCKIERTKDFFDSAAAASATITGVRNITSEFTFQFKKATFNTKTNQTQPNDQTIPGSSTEYSEFDFDAPFGGTLTEDCGDNIETQNPEFLSGTKNIAKIYVDQDDNMNKDIFLIDG